MKMIWDSSKQSTEENSADQGGMALWFAIIAAIVFVGLSITQVSELPRY